MESLQFASDRQFTSIGFPAMGTGNLHFLRDIVTESMFSTVIEFSKENPNTSLKDIRFVLYDTDQATVNVCTKFYEGKEYIS